MNADGVTVGRAAVAFVAAAVAVPLSRSSPPTPNLAVVAAALGVAGVGIWLAPAIPASRVSMLIPAAMMLLVAIAVDDWLPSAVDVGLRAAGPPALAFSIVALGRRRFGSAVAVMGALIAGPFHMLLYDPYLDPGCRGCGRAAIAVWADPGRADFAWRAGMALLALGGVIGLIDRQVELLPPIVATVMFAADPSRQTALVVAVAFATAVWARRCWEVARRHATVQRMLEMHAGTDGFVAGLRRASNDPSLELAFPRLDGNGFVDARGLDAAPLPGQVITDLSIDGETLVRVHHDRSARVPELDVGLDPEAVLRLHRERLNAQLAARVVELSQERRRVMHAGLEQRRSLERDLHDGVQQELLALGLDLRLAIATLPPGHGDGAVLQAAMACVHDCVDQVRTISASVSPPMLETLGLGAALAALVRRRGETTVPILMGDLPGGRLPDDVELAIYSVVADGLARGATRVTLTPEDGAIRVAAAGSAELGAEDGTLPDLVAAVGGRVWSNGITMEAMIPCA